MNEASPKVYERPEEYKVGWVHGFYDCMSSTVDHNSRERRRSVILQNSNLPWREAARLYDEGYYDGFGRGMKVPAPGQDAQCEIRAEDPQPIETRLAASAG